MKFSQTSSLAILLILSLVLAMSACRFDPSKGLAWNADMTAPIAQSEVSIFDFNKDSLFQVGDANLINVVYRDTVFSAIPSDYINLPDTSIKQAISLGTLSITSEPIVQKITMGFLLRQIIAQGGPAAPIAAGVYNQPTGTDVFIPTISNLTSPPYSVDASQFFTEALIKSGHIELTITNKLKLELANISFQINNENLGDIIIKDSFPSIPPGAFEQRQYDMANKYIESKLAAAMTNMTIMANIIPLDTNDYLEIKLQAVDLKASQATAAFPSQTIIDSVSDSEYSLGAKIELTELRLKYGLIKIDAYSSIEDTLQFTYEILSAWDKFGNHPGIYGQKLPPAVGGVPTIKTYYDTLYDVRLDLRNGRLGYNTRKEHIQVGLLSSGQIFTFDQSDSLFLFFGLVEMQPTYVEGYLGKDTVVFQGEQAFEAFKQFQIDEIFFEDPKLDMTLANAVGADARMDIKQIRFSNTQKQTSLNLNAPFIQTPQYLLGPRMPNVGKVESLTYNLDKNNSNIREVIKTMPDKVAYHARVIANYSGTPGVRNNFVTDSSYLSAIMDFRLPVHGSIKNLILSDTVAVDFSSTVNMDRLDRVDRATLKLLIDNQFPFQASVDAVLFDEFGQEIALLANAFVIQAGAVNTNTGFVDAPMRTTYSKTFENPEILDILKRSRKLTLRYRFDTRPENQSVKVFSTYKIKAKLVGDVSYRFGA